MKTFTAQDIPALNDSLTLRIRAGIEAARKSRTVPDYRCCENERRNMNGGCDNCGDPCL